MNRKSSSSKKKTKSDIAYAIAKGTVAQIPGIGGVLSELIGLLYQSPSEKEFEQWINDTNKALEVIKQYIEKEGSRPYVVFDPNSMSIYNSLGVTSIADYGMLDVEINFTQPINPLNIIVSGHPCNPTYAIISPDNNELTETLRVKFEETCPNIITLRLIH